MDFWPEVTLTSGEHNVYIASPGGAASESDTIRIGTQGTQTAAFVAGISGASVSGSAVIVDANGQLGVQSVVAAIQTRHPRHGQRQQRVAAVASGYIFLQTGIR